MFTSYKDKKKPIGHPADLMDKSHPDWIPCKNLRLKEGFAIKSKSALDRYQRSKERVRYCENKKFSNFLNLFYCMYIVLYIYLQLIMIFMHMYIHL